MAAEPPEGQSTGVEQIESAEKHEPELPPGAGDEAGGEPAEDEVGGDLNPPGVEMAGFEPLRDQQPGGAVGAGGNYGIILDVEMDVTVELGRTNMRVRDVLSLGEGSVIELDKVVGEPVEIFANGRLIAYGEVVVIDEDFGVRINEIFRKVEGDEQ